MSNRAVLNARSYLAKNKGIITLVGSTRYYDEYLAANRQLTLAGWVVLSCGHFGNSRHKHLDQVQVNEHAKMLHFYKISLSQAVCLVHPGYVGSSTRKELEFAEKLQLPVLNAYSNGEDTVEFMLFQELAPITLTGTFNLPATLYEQTSFQEFARNGLGY